MRTLLFIIILSAGMPALDSCSICSCKKVPCSAFEDLHFQNWFNYQPEHQLIFKNQSAYDTITLQSIYKSEAYEASQGCYNGDVGCSQNLSIESNEIATNAKRKLSLNYFSQTPFGSSVSSKSITLWLQGFNCSANDINDQGLVIPPGIYTGNFSPSLTINGVVYSNVQTITKDTTIDLSIPYPYKVYLSKGQGLVAYEIFPTHEMWVKQ